jgi:hypothetical protein
MDAATAIPMIVKVAPNVEPTLDTEFSVVVRCATNHRFTLLSQVPTGPSTTSFVRIRPSPMRRTLITM